LLILYKFLAGKPLAKLATILSTLATNQEHSTITSIALIAGVRTIRSRMSFKRDSQGCKVL